MDPGSFYALATAVTWAVAVVLFKKSGDGMAPAALNYFKNLIGLTLFLATFPVLGERIAVDAPATDIILLLISGAIGIGVADTLLFRSLNLLGAARSAIISCFYAPLIVMFSFLILGEELNRWMGVGGLLVVVGVGLTGFEKPTSELTRAQLAEGIFLGIAATGLMGIAIVIVKPVLEVHSVLWSTTVRMVGGVGVLTLLVVGSAKIRRQVRAALRPSPIWRFALPGSVIGTYVALLFWIGGFKYATAMTASILNQTSTLFMVLLAAMFLRERLTAAKLAAVGLGFLGGVLVLL